MQTKGSTEIKSVIHNLKAGNPYGFWASGDYLGSKQEILDLKRKKNIAK